MENTQATQYSEEDYKNQINELLNFIKDKKVYTYIHIYNTYLYINLQD